MTNILKILTSKRFWLILATVTVNVANEMKPFANDKVMVVLNLLAAVSGVILTAISPTSAEEKSN